MHAGNSKRLNVGRSPLQIEWWRIFRALQHPDLELTPEEFSPLWQTFVGLLREGFCIDPMLQVLLMTLARQILYTDADCDDDTNHDSSDDDPTGGRFSDDDSDTGGDDDDGSSGPGSFFSGGVFYTGPYEGDDAEDDDPDRDGSDIATDNG